MIPEKEPKIRPSLWKRFRGVLDYVSEVEPVGLSHSQIASEALDNAHGLNKAVVELAETYRQAAERKDYGTFNQSFDSDDRKRLNPTNMWTVRIVIEKTEDTEKAPQFDSLPNLLLQNEEVAVSSLAISVSSGEKGVSSIIWFNSTQGLAENNRNPKGEVQFGSAVRVDIDKEGSINFSRESDSGSGFRGVSYTESNLMSFIEQVQANSALQT